MRGASGCSFCGCGAWNRNPSAGACLHEGALATAPRATAKWVCVYCEYQTDDWTTARQHYFHTGHGFVSTEQRPSPQQEPTGMKRFTSIRWNQKTVALEWTVQDGETVHAHEFSAPDAPHADFNAALQALGQDVLIICDLDDTYADGMRVQSVSLSFAEKTSARGAVVTALKTLAVANAPLALHTPHLLAEGKAKDEEKQNGKAEPEETKGVMPAGMWKRIETLEAEAWAYLDGKHAPKAQLGLALAAAKEPEPELAGV